MVSRPTNGCIVWQLFCILGLVVSEGSWKGGLLFTIMLASNPPYAIIYVSLCELFYLFIIILSFEQGLELHPTVMDYSTDFFGPKFFRLNGSMWPPNVLIFSYPWHQYAIPAEIRPVVSDREITNQPTNRQFL